MELLRTSGKIVTVAVVAGIVGGLVYIYVGLFSAPKSNVEVERFIVAQGETLDDTLAALKEDGFIKSIYVVRVAISWESGTQSTGGHAQMPEAGGYKISKSMDAWQIAGVLTKAPYMRWVTIPEGLRKEEIADILAERLGWTDAEKTEWIAVDTASDADHTEGVYFPDTYLISVDETPADVADRIRKHFDEVFAPYAKEALAQNIKWTTVLKMASIIQREAGGTSDMPLIAGILWNRLEAGMPLGIDATIQYARGNIGKGWWAPISVSDKSIKSPYNTYLYPGLPPHPISNPGRKAIKAALHPEETACFYYLHDNDGVIHCAKTYAEHQGNINVYLK